MRLLPGSKRYPHFNSDALAASLATDGIGYEHCRDLGGRRKPRPDSPNIAWRNDSFRGYADHMETHDISRGCRAVAGGAHAQWTDRIDVRGSGLVAVSSGIDFGLPESPRGRGAAHSRREENGTHPFTSAATVIDERLSYAGTPELKL